MRNLLSKKDLKKINKFFSVISIVGLVFNIFFTNFSFLENVPLVSAQDLCQVPVDVVMVLDTSGSMTDGGNGSICEWTYLDFVGDSYQWVDHTELGLTQSACNSRCLSSDEFCQAPPVYTPATLSKIESAKVAAKDFLNYTGPNDQSALLAFNDSASLVKQLSSNHLDTKSAIDGLTTGGATNIGEAIEFSSAELGSDRTNPQAVKAMILLTDGKANKPNGDGTGENPADVAYAEAKAVEAAALGYKIFTIGLGTAGEINETMLQNIANTTGAQYYHTDNGDDLSGIYDQIAFTVCNQYGSISGCKYSDVNNNGLIDEDEPKLSGWGIVLAGDFSDTQITDENGCYSFAGLSVGNYTLAEGANIEKQPYTQVWPVGNLHQVSLAEGENLTNFDFANYLPLEEPAANNIISGYKYQDNDGVASTTDDWLGVSGWIINLFISQNTSTSLYSTTTDSLGYFEFNNLTAGDYQLTEDLVADWVQLSAPSAVNLIGTSTVSSNNNFVNYYNSEEPAVCGNGEIEEDEVCDDGDLNGTGGHCNLTCDGQTIILSGGGGGGGIPPGLTIYNESSNVEVSGTSAIITWQTNYYSTSRVIYATENEPHSFDYSNPPNYGYAHSTIDDLNMVTAHQVELTDLIPSTLYYYRVISHASPDTVGLSYTFVTPAVKPEEPKENETENKTEPNPDQVLTLNNNGNIPGGSIQNNLNSNNNSSGEGSQLEDQPSNNQEQTGQVAGGQVAGEQEACNYWPWWITAIMLIIYLILMALNYVDRFNKELTNFKKRSSRLFALLLIILPAVVYLSSSGFAWWAWPLIAVAYIIVLIAYIADLYSSNYWRLSIIITLYLLLMFSLLKMFVC
ncbi:MAG: VWA domain-containing protein [Candidatus Buchananbacteria bacterium]|nr:VWA domain-containing protein [Candidatus Buchananbacteria bacterium]